MTTIGKVIIYHGGDLVRRMDFINYVGGKCQLYEDIEFETIFLHRINNVVAQLGYEDFIVHYRRHNEPLLTGLKKISSDVDCVHMCELAQSSGVCEMYVEHVPKDHGEVSEQETRYYNYAEAAQELEDLFGTNNASNDGAGEGKEAEHLGEEEVNAWIDEEIMSDADEELREAVKMSEEGGHEDPPTAEWDFGPLSGEYDAGEDSDDPITPPGSDDEGTPRERKYRVFNSGLKPENIEFEPGLIFTNKAEFRKALTDYAVATCTNVHTVRSDKTRYQGKCVEGCPWYIWAGQKGRESTWQVKRYVGKHICGKTFDHKGLVSYKWLADKFKNKMTSRFRAKDIKNFAMEDHRVNVSETQCKMAKRLAMEKVHGAYNQQFGKLQDYCHELLRSNRGSTIKLCAYKGNVTSLPIFQRLYICFHALKEGFRRHCRPVIGLDGCFLKSFTKGQLLVAVSRDAGNHMYLSAQDGSTFVNMPWLRAGIHEVSYKVGSSSTQTSHAEQQDSPRAPLSRSAGHNPNEMTPSWMQVSDQPHVQKPKRAKKMAARKKPNRKNQAQPSQAIGHVTSSNGSQSAVNVQVNTHVGSVINRYGVSSSNPPRRGHEF